MFFYDDENIKNFFNYAVFAENLSGTVVYVSFGAQLLSTARLVKLHF